MSVYVYYNYVKAFDYHLRTKIHAAHEASRGGFFDVLCVMAAHGVFFDQMDDKGNNPMHLAAHHGHDMCCKFLGQRGIYIYVYAQQLRD